MSLGAATTAPGGGPAPAGRPGPPAAPPKRGDLLRIIDRVQKKDTMNIFREPVTDDVVRRLRPWCMASCLAAAI